MRTMCPPKNCPPENFLVVYINLIRKSNNLRDHTLPSGKVIFVLDKNGKVSEMKIDIPNPDFDFIELELKWIDAGQ